MRIIRSFSPCQPIPCSPLTEIWSSHSPLFPTERGRSTGEVCGHHTAELSGAEMTKVICLTCPDNECRLFSARCLSPAQTVAHTGFGPDGTNGALRNSMPTPSRKGRKSLQRAQGPLLRTFTLQTAYTTVLIFDKKPRLFKRCGFEAKWSSSKFSNAKDYLQFFYG